MIPLTTHEQFKQLVSSKSTFLIWFSAAWCGPCQAMDKATLTAAAKEAQLPFYYCDQTVNEETVEHCGIKSFPTFGLYKEGLCVSARRSADTTKVCQFIRKG
jgi:thioredoxin 1